MADLYDTFCEQVIEAEKKRVCQQRKNREAPLNPDSEPEQFTGLAFSGGGIRSASFALGILQSLHQHALLQFEACRELGYQLCEQLIEECGDLFADGEDG